MVGKTKATPSKRGKRTMNVVARRKATKKKNIQNVLAERIRALEAAKGGKNAIDRRFQFRNIATKYRVSVGTVSNYNKDLIEPAKQKAKAGRPPLLPNEVEEQIATALVNFQKSMTWGIHVRDIQTLVNQFLAQGGAGDERRHVRVDRHWRKRFMKRQKAIVSARRASNFSSKHKKAEPAVISVFLLNFLGALRMNNCVTNGKKILLHNMDESNVTIPVPRMGPVVAEPGARNVRSNFSVEEPSQHITVLGLATYGHGIAQYGPPLFIKGAMHGYIYDSELEAINASYAGEGGGITCTSAGFVNGHVMEQWVEKVFAPYCRKIDGEQGEQFEHMLLLDNHRSRLSLRFIEKCKELGIHVLLLPPNTTQWMQPLDVGGFGFLKQNMQMQVTEKLADDNVLVLKTEDMLTMYLKALALLDSTRVMSAFEEALGVRMRGCKYEFATKRFDELKTQLAEVMLATKVSPNWELLNQTVGKLNDSVPPNWSITDVQEGVMKLILEDDMAVPAGAGLAQSEEDDGDVVMTDPWSGRPAGLSVMEKFEWHLVDTVHNDKKAAAAKKKKQRKRTGKNVLKASTIETAGHSFVQLAKEYNIGDFKLSLTRECKHRPFLVQQTEIDEILVALRTNQENAEKKDAKANPKKGKVGRPKKPKKGAKRRPKATPGGVARRTRSRRG